MKATWMKVSMAAGAMIVLLSIPGMASAQYHERGSGRPPFTGNPGRQNGNWHIRRLVDDAERDSNSLRYAIEHQGNGRSRGNGRNSQLKSAMQRLDEAFERLRAHADDGHPKAGRNEMNVVIDRAQEFARVLDRGRDSNRGTITDRWNELRGDIGRLADAYDLRYRAR